VFGLAKMSVSFSKESGRTSLKHNNREKEIPHVDKSNSHENVYLRQEKIQDVYEQEFGEALEKYNEKQTRNDRKIDNYYSHIRKSKKHETQFEFIVQVGERDDHKTQRDREKSRDMLKTWFKGFEKENPRLHVYNAVIHMDEATPHMHINLVPVAEGYKNGLEKQASFDKALKNQGEQGKTSKDRFQSWRDNQIGRMTELMQEQGIERKEVGKNNLKNYHEYKEAMRALEQIQGQYHDLSSKYKQIKGEYDVLNHNMEKDSKNDSKLLEGKSGLFTNKVSFTEEQIEQANDKYAKSVQSAQTYKNFYEHEQGRNKELEKDKRALEKENKDLKEKVSSLEAYKDVAKEFMQAASRFLERHLGISFPEAAIKENPELDPEHDQAPKQKRKENEQEIDGPSL